MFENCQEYYTGLSQVIKGNRYLDIYGAILEVKRSEQVSQETCQMLSEIKHLQGFATCWGHAKEIMQGYSPKVLESLEYYYLKLLPGFVPYVPQAKRVENQKIIAYLLQRSNQYKRVSNPKFHSYDRVINILCATDIVVSPQNCKSFKGVGPKIAQHIKDFLTGGNTPSSSEPQKRRRILHRKTSAVPQLRELFKRPKIRFTLKE